MRPHTNDLAPSSTDVNIIAALYTCLLGTIEWKNLDTPETFLNQAVIIL